MKVKFSFSRQSLGSIHTNECGPINIVFWFTYPDLSQEILN